ncbi:GroES-like protein [Massarina eburnea CBS 473.64]|uniref:GroES-like protein n=1 Tax=Massarina eburnea CBS 473.64 TaxID=1395130 RepID=A0A6A6RQC7_9PLEO|nr:GroES-like protein [Massarina eburnea CBS 473.64]
MSNQASWIPAPSAQVAVGDAETYTPSAGELLVKVHSIAFSPIEAKIQKFATHPIPYPNILGSSFAGTVEAVGPDVTSFEKGDNIATIRAGKNYGDPRFGAYQKYALASVTSTSKLGPSTPLHAASAAILNTSAMVSALTIYLGLDRPVLSGSPTSENKNKKMLIYGGSSSCGGLGIKYAVEAGYTVITTSSAHNRSFVESLGPAHIIDHRLPESEVVAQLTEQGPYDAIFDTIGTPPATSVLFSYLESLDKPVTYHSLIPPLPGTREAPESIKRVFAPYNFAFAEEKHRGLAKWLYEEYIPKGLVSGKIVATRQEVLEGGLGSVQGALDRMNEDKVSGVKLVVDPWV